MGNDGLPSAPKTAVGPEPTLPEYLTRFRTKNTIPAFFREAGSLPDRLAVADDRTPATTRGRLRRHIISLKIEN